MAKRKKPASPYYTAGIYAVRFNRDPDYRNEWHGWPHKNPDLTMTFAWPDGLGTTRKEIAIVDHFTGRRIV